MITITLSAARGAGKSFIATAIAKHLTELGYTVTLSPSVDPTQLPQDPKGRGLILVEEREPQ